MTITDAYHSNSRHRGIVASCESGVTVIGDTLEGKRQMKVF